MPNSHDHVFKNVMTDPNVARDLFIQQYPSEVIAKIDLTTLSICQNTFVDAVTENELVVDVLYKANFIGADKQAYLYFLSEAQLKPDRMMPWRVVKYTVRIIDQHLKETNSQILPVVLPIIVYQGKSRYPYPTNIFALFNDSELAKAFMFGEMHLLDVSQLTAEELEASGLAGLMLAVFQHAHLRDLVKIIHAIMPYIERFKEHKRYLQAILMYITRLAKIEDKQQFFATINQLAEPVRSEIMTVDQIWINEGRAQGKLEGKLEGEHTLLLRQLRSKFKHLPDNYLRLIDGADEAKFLHWSDKILVANNLEEVFN